MKECSLLLSLLLLLLGACNNSQGPGELSTKSYRVESIRNFREDGEGYRPFFEKAGITFLPEERIRDSADTNIIIFRLTERNHKLVSEIIESYGK